MKKKIIYFLLLAIIPLCSIIADENSSQNYYKTNVLISNLDQIDEVQLSNINELTIDLTSMEKNMLYESNKKSATVPFAINFLVGFGIGSYIQGDKKGGNIALTCDLLSLAFISAGYSQALSSAYNSSYTGSEGSSLITIGLLGYLATRIYELARPFSYASSFNNNLSTALMAVAVVPELSETNELNMSVSYKIKL